MAETGGWGVKINEVEALAGISKKNIRFYEEQGLLSPRRNADNGYRVYGDEEVAILRRIRVLRKLGVPIEEIRQMFDGTHTVGDGMRRHLISLEREKRNLEQSIALCTELQNAEIPASQLDTEALLERMEAMERGGVSFSSPPDVRMEYTVPIVITLCVVLFCGAICGCMVWAYCKDPQDAPPLGIVGILVGIFAALGVGAVCALMQRIREIGKGELHDARRY